MKVTLAPRDRFQPWSPRRCLRLETDLCPSVPHRQMFGAAWEEAVAEQYGWPEEEPKLSKEDQKFLDDWLYEQEMRELEIMEAEAMGHAEAMIADMEADLAADEAYDASERYSDWDWRDDYRNGGWEADLDYDY